MIRTITILAIVLVQMICPTTTEAAKNRAVSLRVLDATLKANSSKEALKLCRITRINGFVIDQQGRDIILIGQVDPSSPPLHVDDFVVALRNAHMKYAEVKGNTYYYSAPGCSIDPQSKVMLEMLSVKNQLTSASTIEESRRCFEEYQNVARQAQNVRVMGVPFDSHFAKVMVDADYYMKRLTDGSVELEIEGFSSLWNLRKDNDASNTTAQSWMNRFWFCPAETTYTKDGDAVLLKDCRVKLLTEQQYVSTQGELYDSGGTDVLAEQYAEMFTRNYDTVATKRPVYRELEELFRMVALAKLMRETSALSKVGLKINHIMEQRKLEAVPVSRRVLGLTRFEESVQRTEKTGGYIDSFVWHVSSGGVSMDIRPVLVKHIPAPTVSANNAKEVSRTSHSVIKSRKSPKDLFWDY